MRDFIYDPNKKYILVGSLDITELNNFDLAEELIKDYYKKGFIEDNSIKYYNSSVRNPLNFLKDTFIEIQDRDKLHIECYKLYLMNMMTCDSVILLPSKRSYIQEVIYDLAKNLKYNIYFINDNYTKVYENN